MVSTTSQYPRDAYPQNVTEWSSAVVPPTRRNGRIDFIVIDIISLVQSIKLL